MRVPPAGTQPQGTIPYPYAKNEGELAGAQLKNPLAINQVNLERGQKIYNTFCIVCHGPTGKGNGFIVPEVGRLLEFLEFLNLKDRFGV